MMRTELAQSTKDTINASGAATITIGSGVGTLLGYLPVALGCIATIAGIILSATLTIKALNDIRYAKEDRRYKESLRREVEERIKNNEPCRRCADKEILGEIK